MSWGERVRGWLAAVVSRPTLRAPDQRKSPRFAAEVPLVISVVGDEEISSVRTLANGISLGGLSARGVDGLVVGQGVSLELHFPNSTQPIWLEGVVRHNSGCYGIEFISLSEAQQKLIKRYCRLQPRQKRRPA